jgi:hypothetical protein
MLSHLFSKKKDGYNGEVMALMNVVNYLDFQCNHVATAVIDLHEKGYVEDFVVSGKYLFWVQEKVYIKATEFSIVKCLRFNNPDKKNKVLLIMGVIATTENVKGIVINYYNAASQIPAAIAARPGKIKLNSSKQLVHN